MPGIPKVNPYAIPSANQLPINVADWKIDPKRSLLLVHDMQRFFVRKIPLDEPRTTLLKNTSLLRQCCTDHRITVAYTGQTGNMTHEQRGLIKSFWGPGMKAESNDRQIVDELTPIESDWSFDKWRYSAFYNSKLLDGMRKSGYDQLIICGVYAHIGILATAVEAFSHDIETFIIADAVADFSRRHHMMALNYAATCCAVVLPTFEVLKCLKPY